MKPPGPVTQHVGRLLAQRADSLRLVKGYELWDDSCVRDLVVTTGGINAVVLGSRPSPYEVTINWADSDWPDDARDLRFRCDCPDWGDPCKHAIAVALAAASQADSDDRDVDDVDFSRAARPEPTPLPIVDDRPSWAEHLAAPNRATSLDHWLGDTPEPRRRINVDGDPLEHYVGLGPLVVDGVDLAPAIQLLIFRLIES